MTCVSSSLFTIDLENNENMSSIIIIYYITLYNILYNAV